LAVPFSFAPYAICVVVGLIVGVVFIRNLDKASREARLALYDLIWLLSAPVVGFLVTFSGVGEKYWDLLVRNAESQHGFHMQHLSEPIKSAIAKDFCNKSEADLRLFLGNRNLHDLPIKVCTWATDLDQAVKVIKESKLAVKQNCLDTPLHRELKIDLFAKGKQYCGAATETYGLCGQAYCDWSQSNLKLQITLGNLPRAIDRSYPPLAPVLEIQKNLDRSPELNSDSRGSLVPVEHFDYRGWLLALCALLGFRLAKALSDAFYKARESSTCIEKRFAWMLLKLNVFKAQT
jgi:hypothetical protein